MPSLPRAILFDLDETLLSFGSRPERLTAVAEALAPALAPLATGQLVDRLEAAFQAFWSDPARHRAGRQDLAKARFDLVASVFAELRDRAPGLTPQTAQVFADRFHAEREAGARLFPGALETVVALKNRGVRLALVTNGAAATQRAKIDRFDLTRYFEHIQIEGEVGFGKPEPQAYLHALETLGVRAQDTWMVGDNLEWEVAGPQRLGIRAIWHDHLGQGLPKDSPIIPDRTILTIPELVQG